MSVFGYFEAGGVRLRDDPARDPCFTIVRRDREMHEHAGDGPVVRRELVHRHMANELTSLDIAAQCLADFPDADWGLRMELARQCWDESRHVRALHRRLHEMGGAKGEFPITVFEWNVTAAIDNLPGRLAAQNRTLEAGAMDVVGALIEWARRGGDHRTEQVLDGILADEIQHVRFANRWIKTLVAGDRRLLLKVAAAIRFVADANVAFLAVGPETNVLGTRLRDPQATIPAVNVDDRRLAEFSDDEIAEILRQAGFRSLTADLPAERP